MARHVWSPPAAIFGGRLSCSPEIHVFAGSLVEDLRLAAPSAGERQLWDVLELAGAAEWAAALSEGLQTPVGDGGHRLTSAQGQQLALARLALIDPPIAILDEATADAGSAGSTLLEDVVTRALRGRTAIIVAHRLAQASWSPGSLSWTVAASSRPDATIS